MLSLFLICAHTIFVALIEVVEGAQTVLLLAADFAAKAAEDRDQSRHASDAQHCQATDKELFRGELLLCAVCEIRNKRPNHDQGAQGTE
mmetsp:Transcript_21712/g.29127  ORF Transcript_21712/g.29127 Transcript_21712/m.29127 type:complete len:89 (-) Transcript_21712:1076-1342(-)